MSEQPSSQGRLFLVVGLLAVLGIVLFAVVSLASNRICPGCKPTRSAWVSGLDECPQSTTYGDLVSEQANLYYDAELNEWRGTLDHRTPVEVLQELPDRGVMVVEGGGKRGYIQDVFIVDYDPAGGIQGPEPEYCADFYGD